MAIRNVPSRSEKLNEILRCMSEFARFQTQRDIQGQIAVMRQLKKLPILCPHCGGKQVFVEGRAMFICRVCCADGFIGGPRQRAVRRALEIYFSHVYHTRSFQALLRRRPPVPTSRAMFR